MGELAHLTIHLARVPVQGLHRIRKCCATKMAGLSTGHETHSAKLISRYGFGASGDVRFFLPPKALFGFELG